MPEFVVYSRRGCHLCEVLIEELADIVTGRARITVRDVDTRDDWRQSFGLRVPVVLYEGRHVCDYTLDSDAIRALLAAPA